MTLKKKKKKKKKSDSLKLGELSGSLNGMRLDLHQEKL